MQHRIQMVRTDAKLSVQAFAERIGVSREAVRLLESGKSAKPAERTIRDICREFNINREWLVTGEGEMKVKTTQPASLDTMAQANQIDALTRAVVETLIEMPQAQRDAFLRLVQDVAERVRRADADSAQPLQIDQDVKALIRDAKAQGKLDYPDAPELQTK